MSWKVVDAVLLTTLPMPHNAHSVLIALAQPCAHDGTHAYPSQARIGAMMRLSPSSVKRGLAWLEGKGLIVPTAHDSGGRPRAGEPGHGVTYQIRLERVSQGPTDVGVCC